MKNFLTILTLSLVFAACGGTTEQPEATTPAEAEAVSVPVAEPMTLPDTTMTVPDSLGAVADTVAAAAGVEG